jgi:uncharacterized hydrophobic protein (TIGR00271 family)
MLEQFFENNKFDQAYLPTLQKKLCFEGECFNSGMVNYFVLLTLSTVISTYGVISGSTATVIGAMIIAPLMTPIMGTTLSIVLGETHRATRSSLFVLVSVFYSIFLAVILSVGVSSLAIDFNANNEILSRIAPDILALFVALASGAAGAFAVSRESVSDSLPGVAIAISLVPPLSVVGISLSKMQWGDALGATLLFLTNFFAIMVAGGATLWISGVNPGWMDKERSKKRKQAFMIAVICTALISVPLFISGYETLDTAHKSKDALDITQNWLDNSTYRLNDFSLRKQDLIIQISGRGQMPSLDDLHQSLEVQLHMPVNIEVRTIPEMVSHHPYEKK